MLGDPILLALDEILDSESRNKNRRTNDERRFGRNHKRNGPATGADEFVRMGHAGIIY